jgi:hypothetical protein
MTVSDLVSFVAGCRDTRLLRWHGVNTKVTCCCGKLCSDDSTALAARNLSIHWRGCIKAMEVLKSHYPTWFNHYKYFFENTNQNSRKMRAFFAEEKMEITPITFNCPSEYISGLFNVSKTAGKTIPEYLVECAAAIARADNDFIPIAKEHIETTGKRATNSNAISFDHVAELARIQVDIVKLMVAIEESGDSISASERLTSIIDDLLRVKMMIIFSETMEGSGFRICNDTQTE